MRIKLKDLELAIKEIKLNTLSESVYIKLDPDSMNILLEFTDRNNNIAKAKLFDANINVTPELISTQKLYSKE